MPAAPFLTIAHRGASHYAPENTRAAFDLAVRMGGGHIELDVHATADGHLVVIHDRTLDRTTNGTGPVASSPLDDLRQLDAGAWFSPAFAGERIPTFAEVLERYASMHIHAEIKGEDLRVAFSMVEAVGRYGAGKRVTLTAFEIDRLELAHRLAPGLPTGWLVKQVSDEVLDMAQRLGVTQICPKAEHLTEDMVERLHGAGFSVRAWGVSSEDEMRAVVRMGADGMTINYPDRLLRFIRGQEHSPPGSTR